MKIIIREYLHPVLKQVHRKLYGKCITVDRDIQKEHETNELYINTTYKCRDDPVIIEKVNKSDDEHIIYVIILRRIDALAYIAVFEKTLDIVVEHVNKSVKNHRVELRITDEKQTLVI